MIRIARVLDIIVFGGLLGLLVVTVMPYGTVDQWWISFFECAVFALTAIWICGALIKGEWRLRRLVPLVPMFILTAYAFFQTVQLPWTGAGNAGHVSHSLTIDRYQTYLTATKMLALTSLTSLLLLHTRKLRRLSWLVRIVIGIGVGSAVFGILRQFLQSPDSTRGFILPFLYAGIGFAQFISPNAFAFLVEMVFGLMAGLLLGGGVRRQYVLVYLTGIALIWTALVLSNSRGAILGMLCQVVLLLFVATSWYAERSGKQRAYSYLGTSKLVRLGGAVLVLAVLITSILWLGGDRLAGKRATDTDVVDGVTRTQIWHATWDLIKNRPFTGVGFGAYYLAIPQYQNASGRMRVEQAHNEYLDLAANGGIVAIALALWFAAFVIWQARKSIQSSDPYRRAAALGAVAGMIGVAVHSVVDFGLQVTGNAAIFAALLVIALADARKEKRRRSVESETTSGKTRRLESVESSVTIR